MILYWTDEDSFLTAIHNENGSIMLFQDVREAEEYITTQKHSAVDDLRIISIEEAR